MNKYKIKNLITLNEYVITDEDLQRFGQSLEERLEQKKNVYGDSDNRQVTIEDLTPEIIKARISKAWDKANSHANRFDQNSRISLLWYSQDPNCQPERLAKIGEIQAWWANIWSDYAIIKQRILNGEEVEYTETAGDPPYSIWEL